MINEKMNALEFVELADEELEVINGGKSCSGGGLNASDAIGLAGIIITILLAP